MGRYAKAAGEGGDFQQAPAGTHIARCYGIIDLGTQHGEYQGLPTVKNQVVLRWELPLETATFDGQEKPLIVSRFYTNSLHEKARLRHDLENWRSRAFTPEELAGFDLNAIVGAPCMVTIVHNEKARAVVTAVSALPKGTKCPPAFNKPLVFWIEEYDDNIYYGLPQFYQDLIAKSDEFKAAFSPDAPAATTGAPSPVDNDDIPF